MRASSTISYPARRVSTRREPGLMIGVAILRVLGTLGLFLLALLGALIILFSVPYAYLGFIPGLLVLAGAIYLAWRLWRPLPLVLIGLAVAAPMGIVSSQMMAHTPPITGSDGLVVPGSIAELQTVKIGGVDQWLLMRGKSDKNPVLLFLSGGPGGTELGSVRHYNTALEDSFVVVVWEQRGAGKSFAASPYSDITVDRLVEDSHQVTNYLRQRFNQEKIYLWGQSWGTILGVKLAQRYPELFHAFVGAGQMVNTVKADNMVYAYVLDEARKRGDQGAVNTLTGYGPPPYNDSFTVMAVWKYYRLLMGYGMQYEGEEVRALGPREMGGGDPTDTPEFGLWDKLNFWRGLGEGFDNIYIKQLGTLDFETEVPKLDLPVYFMEGRHDHNASPLLVESWFNKLQAPHKELIWFERSGHAVWSYEPSKFNSLMVNKVLAETWAR